MMSVKFLPFIFVVDVFVIFERTVLAPDLAHLTTSVSLSSMIDEPGYT